MRWWIGIGHGATRRSRCEWRTKDWATLYPSMSGCISKRLICTREKVYMDKSECVLHKNTVEEDEEWGNQWPLCKPIPARLLLLLLWSTIRHGKRTPFLQESDGEHPQLRDHLVYSSGDCTWHQSLSYDVPQQEGSNIICKQPCASTSASVS